MDPVADRVRLRRLVRRPLTTELALTERDLTILGDFYENRFMHAGQLQALYGEHIVRRLHLLFHHGYLDRPEAQRVWRMREGGGSKPLVYALSNRGAKTLRRLGIIDANKRDWTERNRDLSLMALFIPHELAVTEVRVAFTLSCNHTPGLVLSSGDALAHGQDARALPLPTSGTLVPDWIFTITDDSGTAEPSLFFLEVDRVTEPNIRYRHHGLQSLARKYESYLAYARAKQHVEQFGTRNVRVLTVTTGGEEKMRHLAQTAHDVCQGVGAGRFLVSNFEALASESPLTLLWINGAGEHVRLGL
jgi:hypothetical protein